MELTNQEMFEYYGISEWEEKREILANEELALLIRELKKEPYNPTKPTQISSMINQLRLPFPKFAVNYFKSYGNYKVARYLLDPSFGYKLYLMPVKYLHKMRDVWCGDAKKSVSCNTNPNDIINKFNEFYITPLENIPNFMTSKRYNKELRRKFIYLTKYIDLEEAERLGLGNAPTFKVLNCDGYELNKKLALFNPIIRVIIEKYYGLKSGSKMEIKEIASLLHLRSDASISRIIKLMEPLLLKEYGVLESKLDPLKNDDGTIKTVDGTILYANKAFRNADLDLTSRYYFSSILSPAGQTVVKETMSFSRTACLTYMIKKYIFPSMTTEEFSNYMIMDRTKIEKIETEAKKL